MPFQTFEKLSFEDHPFRSLNSIAGEGSGKKSAGKPFAAYFLPDGWSIGYSGNILANWKAGPAGDVWTVPLGLGISKVVKLGPLPVKLGLAGQYMVHHPDIGGQKWNIQLTVAPVIPKLIKGTLF